MNTDINMGLIMAIVFIIASIFYLVLITSTYLYDSRTKTRRDYLLTGMTLFFSSFFIGAFTTAENEYLIHAFWSIGFLSFCLFAPVWMIFLTNLITLKNKVIMYLPRVLLVLSAILGILCVLFGDVSFRQTEFGNQVSFQENIFFVSLFVYSSVAFLSILALQVLWLRQSVLRRQRRQVLVILLLAMLAAPAIIMTEYFIPIFTNQTMIPMATLACLPVSLFVFHSMRKYKLFGLTISNISEYSFTSVTMPIYVLDSNNTIMLENIAAIKYLGSCSVGKKISDCIVVNEKAPDESFLSSSFASKTVSVKSLSGVRTCDMALTIESDVFNDALCKIVVLKDMTDITEALGQINDQNNKHASLNEMASRFLSQSDESFEEKMTAGVKVIAEMMDMDSVSVWRNFVMDDEEYTSQIYDWDREEGGTAKPEAEFINVPLTQMTSDVDATMSGITVINGPVRLVEDPITAQVLAHFGIVSAFITPVSVNRKNWGFVIFENRRYECVYDDNAVEAMRSAAYLCVNTVLRMEIERKLETALHEAIEASKVKSEFLAKMSHEIRTPMNAIIGMTELVLREDASNTVHEYATTIKQAGANLLSIINDILDFSKIETGNMQILPLSYSLSSLINDVINIIRMRVSDTVLQFVVNLDSNLPNALIGDEVRIRQALINILGNAVKYTESGHISLTVKGESVDDKTLDLIMLVEDTGSGIKQEDLAYLFDEYHQIRSGTVDGVDGVGLGLAITLGIVEAMDGDISVESEFGKGSAFTLRIPQEIDSHEKLAVVESPLVKSALILENRDVCADSLLYTIKNLGVQCEIASDIAVFQELTEEKAYSFAFISHAVFDSNKAKIIELCSNTQIVLLSEFGESTPVGNWINITMPVHAISVANIFNGVTDGTTFLKTEEHTTNFTAPNASVLVVDDISTNLKVVNGLLLPYKMKVDLRISGREAIEAIKSKRYDVVFMDHRMPDMDGVETTEYIRVLDDNDPYYKELPIIALTANAVSGMKEMFIKSGFNDFMSKPIDTVVLNSVLEKWIPKEKQQQEYNESDTSD